MNVIARFKSFVAKRRTASDASANDELMVSDSTFARSRFESVVIAPLPRG